MTSQRKPGTARVVAAITAGLVAVVAATTPARSRPESDPVSQNAAGTALVPGATEVAGQLADLNRTLLRIQEVLDRLTVHQEIDLLMKRIDLKLSRVDPLQRRVHSTEAEIEGIEKELKQLEMFQQQEDERASSDDANQAEKDASARAAREVSGIIELKEARLETLRLRLIELENDLAANQDEIGFLEEILDERLGLR